MWILIRTIIAFCLISDSFSVIYSPALSDLILAFMKENSGSRLVMFSCPKNVIYNFQLVKSLSEERGVSVYLAGHPQDNLDVSYLRTILATYNNHLIVLLDFDCLASNLLWSFVTKEESPSLVGPLFHWLLISRTNIDNSLLEISGPGPALNSHAVYAYQKDENMFDLTEIYRTGYGITDLQRIPLSLNWKPGDQIPRRPQRNDLMGGEIKIGIDDYDEWSKRTDWSRKHINSTMKHSGSLIEIIIERLNASSTTERGNHFNQNGSYLDIMDLFERKEIDISTALNMMKVQTNIIDNTVSVFLFNPVFILKSPLITATENIYILPFSKAVWLATGIMLFICTFCLILSEKGNPEYEWLETIFTCLGTLFDQGAENSPKSVSSRITFLTLLIQSVFLFNAYSACIVVLLREPNHKINDFNSLLKSPIRIILEESEYNRNYRHITRDQDILRLYNERVDRFNDKEVFVSLDKGLELIRKELVAFHVDNSVYKVISDMYTESEKCELIKIQMWRPWQFTLPLRKESPIRDLIKQNILLLNEVGLNNRWERYWYQDFPICFDLQDSSFDSVTLQDFHPTLEVLGIGLALSIIFLLIEILYNRVFKHRKLRIISKKII